MQHNGPRPNVVSYNASMRACGKAHHWKQVLQLYGAMQLNCTLDADGETYMSMIGACEGHIFRSGAESFRAELQRNLLSRAVTTGFGDPSHAEELVPVINMLRAHGISNFGVENAFIQGVYQRALHHLDSMRTVTAGSAIFTRMRPSQTHDVVLRRISSLGGLFARDALDHQMPSARGAIQNWRYDACACTCRELAQLGSSGFTVAAPLPRAPTMKVLVVWVSCHLSQPEGPKRWTVLGCGELSLPQYSWLRQVPNLSRHSKTRISQ